MKALRFHTFGGPEVLAFEDHPDPQPHAKELVVRTEAIGLNFADVYRRQGRYPLAGEAPFIAGYEAAGVVVTDDPDSEFKPGDRVAFADAPRANAEFVAVPEDRLIPLPDDISADVAAATLLQGLTAQYLLRDSHSLKQGETVLVHAAAGGVGLLLVQMAKHLGGRVLGLVSSETKARAVMEAGADGVALTSSDWVAAAQRFAPGGVDVAYDSVGSTLVRSLESVRTGGRVVFFGMAGGDPVPVDPRRLMDTSKTLTGGDLWNVLTTGAERRRRAAELFRWLREGVVRPTIAQRFPLSEGHQAHATLEGRGVIGKILLIP